MAITGPIEDQLALRALHDNYADAVFRRDAADWGALWADDAVWDLAGTTVNGKDAIVGLWTGAMSTFAFVGFFYQTGALHIDGDTAAGRVYTNETLEDLAGNLRRSIGRYEDTYVKRGGTWLYQSRSFSVLKGYS
ncbi:MAG: nuclear transport factor 2 family protein [Novosphingobium sp.]|nr:nuclear transport factor 2 family protein [Novosphingobium sp.]